MKIGIIGFGRLGKLIATSLAQDFDLLIYDKLDLTNEIIEIGATPSSLEEVCNAKMIIPFVPISSFESVIKQISPLVQENTLIIDVCSVKVHPVKVMLEYLPHNVQILATHPMFGPDSTKDTFIGCKIVLCRERISEQLYEQIRGYLNKHGLKVIEVTPEEHDKQISHSLLLTHFIGRTLENYGAKSLDIDTIGYRRLMKILSTVENDTWQLFKDMNKFNPYAKKTLQRFLESQENIYSRIFN